MGMLYLITGPSGSGKTTVAKTLSKNFEKCMLIDGEDVRSKISSSGNYEEMNSAGFLELVENMIKQYLAENYDVILDYALTNKEYEELNERLTETKTKLVVLLAHENVLNKRNKANKKKNGGIRAYSSIEIALNFKNTSWIFTDITTPNEICYEILSDDRFYT